MKDEHLRTVWSGIVSIAGVILRLLLGLLLIPVLIIYALVASSGVLAAAILFLFSVVIMIPFAVFPMFELADAIIDLVATMLVGDNSLTPLLSFILGYAIGDGVALGLTAFLLLGLGKLFEFLMENKIIGFLGLLTSYSVIFLECILALMYHTHLGPIDIGKWLTLWLVIGVILHEPPITPFDPVFSHYGQSLCFVVVGIIVGSIVERTLPSIWASLSPLRKQVHSVLSSCQKKLSKDGPELEGTSNTHRENSATEDGRARALVSSSYWEYTHTAKQGTNGIVEELSEDEPELKGSTKTAMEIALERAQARRQEESERRHEKHEPDLDSR